MVDINNKFLKGLCYEPFPFGYDPSNANNTCIWFGSDIARENIKPLWGESFSPVDGPDKGKMFKGRDDIKNLSSLGVNLIRLYDWDSRNDHKPFLDYCQQNNIQVLVPVSNYNLGAFGPPPDMNASITGLINSFSNTGDNSGTDYHPAIYAIIISSELDQTEVPVSYLSDYTQKWVEIEQQSYNNFRKLPIGHPVSFAKNGPGWNSQYPCFGYWDKLLPSLVNNTTRDLNKRLMLCPHTYNEASYIYDNAENSGKGWIDITWEKYNLPILFCEIGCSRLVRTDYLQVIQDQLVRSIKYADISENTKRLLGICLFQYCDKVWMPNTTEGSFGIVSNTQEYTDIVYYGPNDFKNSNGLACDKDYLRIQKLLHNPSYDVLKNTYQGKDSRS